MVKTKDSKQKGLRSYSISKPTKDFQPEKLPDKVLDQLWMIAARKNRNDLCEIIEDERFKRLEEEMTR